MCAIYIRVRNSCVLPIIVTAKNEESRACMLPDAQHTLYGGDTLQSLLHVIHFISHLISDSSIIHGVFSAAEDCRSIAAGYPEASAHSLLSSLSCHIDVCPASIIRYGLLLYFPWALINRARGGGGPPQTVQLEGNVQPAYPNSSIWLWTLRGSLA